MGFTHTSGKNGFESRELYIHESGYRMCVLDFYFLNAGRGIVLSCIVL